MENPQKKSPVKWIIGGVIIILLILGYFLYPKTRITPDQGTNLLSPSDQNSQSSAPLKVTVTDAKFTFTLPQYGKDTATLAYQLNDSITLNANRSGGITGTVEVYDDTKKLVASDNTSSRLDNPYLNGGNQVISIPFNLAVKRPGSYNLLVKLFDQSGHELYSQSVNNILVGTTGMPVTKKASITLANSHLSTNSNATKKIYTDQITLINKGNSDILGYYKQEPYLNGALVQPQVYYGSDWGSHFNAIPSQYLVLLKAGDATPHVTTYSDNDYLTFVSCKGGNQVKVKVSFIEVDPDAPQTKEGTVLATAETQTFTCPAGR